MVSRLGFFLWHLFRLGLEGCGPVLDSPFFWEGLSFPCPRFHLAVPTGCCPGSLSFLSSAGVSFLSLPMFADSLGWLPVSPWFSALRCLAAGGVTPLFLSEACRLALVGPQGLWVPQSCGVLGLRDGVTCLRSGLCSSSVLDCNEDFPSLWWVWFLAFVLGSPSSGWNCVLRPAIVPVAIPPSSRIGPAPSGCGSCDHPLGQVCLFIILDRG